MKNFILLHTTLYAKHWYKSKRYSSFFNKNGERGIWYDLAKTLSVDGYFMDIEKPNKYEIVSILNQQCLLILNNFNLDEFISGIDKNNTFKYGYYHKDSAYHGWKHDNEYDYYEAIASFFLSYLFSLDMTKSIIKLPKPDYEKVLPRRHGITDRFINKMFPYEEKCIE